MKWNGAQEDGATEQDPTTLTDPKTCILFTC